MGWLIWTHDTHGPIFYTTLLCFVRIKTCPKNPGDNILQLWKITEHVESLWRCWNCVFCSPPWQTHIRDQPPRPCHLSNLKNIGKWWKMMEKVWSRIQCSINSCDVDEFSKNTTGSISTWQFLCDSCYLHVSNATSTCLRRQRCHRDGLEFPTPSNGFDCSPANSHTNMIKHVCPSDAKIWCKGCHLSWRFPVARNDDLLSPPIQCWLADPLAGSIATCRDRWFTPFTYSHCLALACQPKKCRQRYWEDTALG